MDLESVLTNKSATAKQEIHINLNFEYFKFRYANCRVHAHCPNTPVSVKTTTKRYQSLSHSKHRKLRRVRGKTDASPQAAHAGPYILASHLQSQPITSLVTVLISNQLVNKHPLTDHGASRSVSSIYAGTGHSHAQGCYLHHQYT